MPKNDSYPLVSIIMPCYNHEKYIQESLEALFNQDYPNFEVIIRDDGSTDNTPSIVSAFVSKIKDIHIIVEYGENVGLLRSYNWLLRKSAGDIIMVCASDDVFLLGRISYGVEIHKRFSNIDLIISNGNVISDDGEIIRESFYPDDVESGNSEIRKYENVDYKFAMNFSAGGFGMSFNKKLLEPLDYQLPETLLFEDAYMSFLAAVQNGVVICMKPLIKYRRAINSLSRVDPCLNRIETLKQENRFLKMFLSLESAKSDYLKSNLNVNEVIQKNKKRALNYLEQKIQIIKIKISITEGRFDWESWFRLLISIIKGDKSKYSFKVLILSLLYRKKIKDSIISEYKKRASIL